MKVEKKTIYTIDGKGRFDSEEEAQRAIDREELEVEFERLGLYSVKGYTREQYKDIYNTLKAYLNEECHCEGCDTGL